jgi:hypothetical protein
MPEAASAAIRHLRAGTIPKIPDKRLMALSGMTAIADVIDVRPGLLPQLPAAALIH